MSKTRVLGIQIANSFSPEARVFATLLRHIPDASIEATVFHQIHKGDVERFALASRVPVSGMEFGWRPAVAERSHHIVKASAWARFALALPGALAKARRIKPDVIYSSQQVWDCLAATWIARYLHTPQIIHLHYIIGPWLKAPVLRRLRECHHVITVSDFIRRDALHYGVTPERVTTIRNSMAISMETDQHHDRSSVRQELGIAPDTSLVGIVARLDPTKGQSDTIQAFAQIAAHHPNAFLLIIGAGSPWHPEYLRDLQTLAEQTGHGHQICFLGQRNDVPRLLAALDIFIHPSRRDPCPLALLEASAVGCPVVAYAEGGACEIVIEGVTGLLAPPGDITGLASCLDKLLINPAQARIFGDKGRERIATTFRPEDAGSAFARILTERSYQKISPLPSDKQRLKFYADMQENGL